MAKDNRHKQRKDYKNKPADPMVYQERYRQYSRDIDLNRFTATIGIFPPLFWWPLVKKPDSPFCRECANQGLVLLLLGLIFGLATFIFSLFTKKMLGQYYYYELFGYALLALEVAFCYNGILTVHDGKHFRVPLFGRLKIIK